MREVVGVIAGIVRAARCPSCQGAYSGGDARVLSIFGEYWVLKCVCRNCDSQRCVAVVVRGGEAFVPEEKLAGPPLTGDSVLDVHEFLREFEGNVDDLFKTGLS